jgi:hypothetical protein
MIKHLLVISIESGRLAAAAQCRSHASLAVRRTRAARASALRLKPISRPCAGANLIVALSEI